MPDDEYEWDEEYGNERYETVGLSRQEIKRQVWVDDYLPPKGYIDA